MRAVLLLGVLSIAAPVRPERYAKPEEPKSPPQQLLGDWELVKVGHGVPRREFPMMNVLWRITPSETVFIVNGQPSLADGLTATYVVDWSSNPVAITFMPKQRGGKMPGILKLEGDTLIMGLTTGGDQRPTDFDSAQMIWYYKRAGK